jgi:uncharacterized protein (DUF433 family)
MPRLEHVDGRASDRSIDDATFTPAAVARALRLPLGTVRWWAVGSSGHEPPIRIADPHQHLMSFRNVVEVHVLKAVMGQARDHVPLAVVRAVVTGLADTLGSDHPLSDARMETSGKEFLAASLGAFAHGTHQGHGRLAAAIALHLSRIVRDASGEPARLLLFTRSDRGGPGHVMVDPRVEGGQPCITDSDVSTDEVAAGFKAGDSVADLVRHHGRTRDEIEEAIRYELETW